MVNKLKMSSLEKYDIIDYDFFDSFIEDKEKTYYEFKATTGFIIGVILDNIIPLTFGLLTIKLKKFGKLLYFCKVKNIYVNQLIRNKYTGWFVKSFLE